MTTSTEGDSGAGSMMRPLALAGIWKPLASMKVGDRSWAARCASEIVFGVGQSWVPSAGKRGLSATSTSRDLPFLALAMAVFVGIIMAYCGAGAGCPPRVCSDACSRSCSFVAVVQPFLLNRSFTEHIDFPSRPKHETAKETCPPCETSSCRLGYLNRPHHYPNRPHRSSKDVS